MKVGVRELEGSWNGGRWEEGGGTREEGRIEGGGREQGRQEVGLR